MFQVIMKYSFIVGSTILRSVLVSKSKSEEDDEDDEDDEEEGEPRDSKYPLIKEYTLNYSRIPNKI